MKEVRIGLILDLLLILFNLHFKCYEALILLTIIALIKISKLRYNKFFNLLMKLDKANQLYSSKEEKLELVFGSFDGTFIERCQILKEEAKSSLEGLFYHELGLCSNKTQIETLIENYLVIIKRNSLEFEEQIFLTCILEIIVKKFFGSLFIIKYIEIFNLSTLVILLIEELTRRLDLPIFSSNKKFYVKFYRRLSYLRPMVSLQETLNELEMSNSIYNTLYYDINEHKISDYPKKNQIIINSIYKILINNKFNNEKELKTQYENIMNNQFELLTFVKNYYFVFVLIFMIYLLTLI